MICFYCEQQKTTSQPFFSLSRHFLSAHKCGVRAPQRRFLHFHCVCSCCWSAQYPLIIEYTDSEGKYVFFFLSLLLNYDWTSYELSKQYIHLQKFRWEIVIIWFCRITTHLICCSLFLYPCNRLFAFQTSHFSNVCLF